jgi:nitric oxide reductase subunit B
MTAGTGRRELLVSKGWLQAVALVVLFGFFVLGLLAYRAYSGQPPIPERVVDPSGRVIFTGEDVTAGQGVFLKNGLMQYGSIFGHGAYLGPDYTADYLRRSALSVRESYGGEGSDVAAVTPKAGRSSLVRRRRRPSGSCGDTTRTTLGSRAPGTGSGPRR